MGSGHKANRVCDQYQHLTQQLLCVASCREHQHLSGILNRPAIEEGAGRRQLAAQCISVTEDLKLCSQANKIKCQSSVCALLSAHWCSASSLDFFFFFFLGSLPESVCLLFCYDPVCSGYHSSWVRRQIKVPVEAMGWSVSMCTNTFEVAAYVAAWCGPKLAFQFQFGKTIWSSMANKSVVESFIPCRPVLFAKTSVQKIQASQD